MIKKERCASDEIKRHEGIDECVTLLLDLSREGTPGQGLVWSLTYVETCQRGNELTNSGGLTHARFSNS